MSNFCIEDCRSAAVSAVTAIYTLLHGNSCSSDEKRLIISERNITCARASRTVVRRNFETAG